MCRLKWQFTGDSRPTYMMGTNKSPSTFHRMSQCIKQCMEPRGYKLVAYLDYFIVVSETYEECLQGQHELIVLLRRFGLEFRGLREKGLQQNSRF